MSDLDPTAPGTDRPARPERRRRARAATVAMAAAFVLHGLAALWLWARWGPGVRSGILVWMDLPVSLLYGQLRGAALLGASLVFGGLWWAALAGLAYRVLGAAVALARGSEVASPEVTASRTDPSSRIDPSETDSPGTASDRADDDRPPA